MYALYLLWYLIDQLVIIILHTSNLVWISGHKAGLYSIGQIVVVRLRWGLITGEVLQVETVRRRCREQFDHLCA